LNRRQVVEGRDARGIPGEIEKSHGPEIAISPRNRAIFSADSTYTDREYVRNRQLPDGGTTFVLQLHEDATDDKHQA
jgi:hypothetical protein